MALHGQKDKDIRARAYKIEQPNVQEGNLMQNKNKDEAEHWDRKDQNIGEQDWVYPRRRRK